MLYWMHLIDQLKKGKSESMIYIYFWYMYIQYLLAPDCLMFVSSEVRVLSEMGLGLFANLLGLYWNAATLMLLLIALIKT